STPSSCTAFVTASAISRKSRCASRKELVVRIFRPLTVVAPASTLLNSASIPSVAAAPDEDCVVEAVVEAIVPPVAKTRTWVIERTFFLFFAIRDTGSRKVADTSHNTNVMHYWASTPENVPQLLRKSEVGPPTSSAARLQQLARY